MTRAVLLCSLVACAATYVAACTRGLDEPEGRWAGTMDTAAAGHVVVRNPATPIWLPGEQWVVEEVVAIGSALATGPDMLGRVEDLEVDRLGRVWVLDSQAKELRVFGRDGQHVRTIGRSGRGPGEFLQPVSVRRAPDGTMWVVDVGNNWIAAFDTTGEYRFGNRIPTGYPAWPWVGGFDQEGFFYAPVPDRPSATEQVAFTLARHDRSLSAVDTLVRPRDPISRRVVEYQGMPVRVPFQGTFTWQLSRSGTVWTLLTDEYKLSELAWSGDTLRTVLREFEPRPITEHEKNELRTTWRQSNRTDTDPPGWAMIARSKPPITGTFFIDDQDYLWVERNLTPSQAGGSEYDIFDRDGRYVGELRLPFRLRARPSPVFAQGYLYGLTFGELDIPRVVIARLDRSNRG